MPSLRVVPFVRPAAALAACALLAALAGCELFKKNDETLAVVNQRVIGMPVGTFFDRYGRGAAIGDLPDGGAEYNWTSPVGYARPGPEGSDDRICRMRLTTDRRGRIGAVNILFDATGRISTSRCREIFAAP